MTEEVSIGDFVLSGGELAAAVCIEAIVRLRDDVLGNEESGGDRFLEAKRGYLPRLRLLHATGRIPGSSGARCADLGQPQEDR